MTFQEESDRNISEILSLISQINEKLGIVQAEQATTNARLGELEKGQKSIRGDIGNLYQNHDKHMKIISEGLGHLNDRYTQLDKVENQTDDHSNRIFALEQKVSNG